MSVIVLLIVAGGTVAAGFLGAFLWAVSSGQFHHTATPPWRVLLDEDSVPAPRGDRHAREGIEADADAQG
jgi:cbb3-type cytochrome oxidase maturation protein